MLFMVFSIYNTIAFVWYTLYRFVGFSSASISSCLCLSMLYHICPTISKCRIGNEKSLPILLYSQGSTIYFLMTNFLMVIYRVTISLRRFINVYFHIIGIQIIFIYKVFYNSNTIYDVQDRHRSFSSSAYTVDISILQ